MRRKGHRLKVAGRAGYLARETGGFKKKWKDRLAAALIFPNSYAVGMSNLGFQLVYDQLNRHPDMVAERVFLPEDNEQPLSVESGRPLRDFPLIFCSISFEDDFPRLAAILARSGLGVSAAERAGQTGSPAAFPAPGNPLIIAGGVATFINPEPLAHFIDLFLIGEAEPLLGRVIDFLLEKIGRLSRDDLLRGMAANFSGCYAPRFYQVTYNPDGTVAEYSGPPGLPARIKKNLLTASPDAAGHSRIISPDAEFADLYMTEMGRGCSRGCRFCAAGFVYRPPRLWPAPAIINSLDQRPAQVNRIGLLGMEMAKPEDLARISEHLLNSSCALSFSSLRADVITPTLLELLQRSNLKSAAIAPDGGSERLRRVINKGITEEDVLQGAESLVRAGIMNLKLYFMIGLPTEGQDDLEEMLSLVLKIKKNILAYGRSKGRLSNMTLSVNCFVPKPWTPFQYHPFEPVPSLKAKIKFLRKGLAGQANLRIKAERPANAFLQAVMARGDRRVGKAIATALPAGGKKWQQAFKATGIKPADYANRQRGREEVFPWEIIDHRIDRNYLWAEYRKAIQGKTTPPCDTSKCKRCGVCNG